ncbi:MAG: sulfatase [Kiritimatiellia bacterium]
MTNRRTFLKTAGCGLSLAMAGGVMPSVFAQAAHAKMNILFIMTDDHAAHAISAYGSRINKTPQIDRLAQEGVRCDRTFVTNSICTPSRAGILTGMYSCQNGVPVFNDLSPKIKTVGGYLRDAGYFTAMIGKWHLGGPGAMRDADWNRWAIYQGQGQYFDPFFFTKTGTQHFAPNKGRISFPGEYASENITKVTQDVIDEALEQKKPFFVMMHHKAPHRNWLPSDKYRAQFRALTLKEIPPPDTLFDTWTGRASGIQHTAMTLEHHMRPEVDLKLTEYFTTGGKFPGVDGTQYLNAANKNRWPIELREDSKLAPEEQERRRRERIKLAYLRYMQDYLACVQSVDDSVGEMLDYLKKKGVDDHTMVIYTSDQGFFLGDHGFFDKRLMLEESLKMPFLVRCPALVKAGTVNEDLIINVDFPALFVDVAGAPRPATFQGRSFLPNITVGTPADWRKSFYYRYYIQGGEHQTPAHQGVRTQRYKLIYYYKNGGEWELFDLQKDPEELTNLYHAPAYAKVVQTLKEELARLKSEVGDHDQYFNADEYHSNPNLK